MDIRSKGTWHFIYFVLVGALFVVFSAATGATSLASMTAADQAWLATVGAIAFILLPVTGLFWILAIANIVVVKRYHEQKEEMWHLKVVVRLYELASEFLSRFADHYFQVVGAHPENKKNRLNTWVVVVFAAAIANQVEDLGDVSRATKLRTLLMRQMSTVHADAEHGGMWAELKGAASAVLAGGRIPVADVPVECFEAAQSTRLSDHVIDFEARDSATSS